MESGTLLDLDQVVRDAWEMAPLPASAGRLAALVADDRSNLSDLVEVVEYDQALTAKLLRAANSAASAAAAPITTVAQAIQRLGGGIVLSFATAHGVAPAMQRALDGYAISEGRLWRHSVLAALTVQMQAPVLRISVSPVTFTVALLHDIGKLILDRYLEPEIVERLRRAAALDGRSEEDAETEVLGVSHAEVGAMMAQHWSLPRSIARGIYYHHAPDRYGDALGGLGTEGEQRICDLVHVADVISHSLGGEYTGEPSHAIQAGAWRRLGLDEGKIDELLFRVSDEFEGVLARYEP